MDIGKCDTAIPTEAQAHLDCFLRTDCFRESVPSSKVSSYLKITRMWLTNQASYIMHQ